MRVRIELFYSPICPHCPEAKKVLLEVAEEFGEKIQVKEINVFSPAGLERAEKHGVKRVPTMIVNSEVKVMGVPTREGLRRIIQRESKGIE